jgi:hypothetical protein
LNGLFLKSTQSSRATPIGCTLQYLEAKMLISKA